jgi:ribosomal protein S18 acetylase RimI-like enzyme
MSPSSEILEASTPAQIDYARALFREYQAQLPAPLRFPDQEWVNLPGKYAAPEGALLVATVAGLPAGCVGLRSFPIAGASEMKRLYVRPGFRGYRLGKTLVEEVIAVARRKGYLRLRLDTHVDTMQAAVNLYRRFGFREIAPEPMTPVPGLSCMELLP